MTNLSLAVECLFSRLSSPVPLTKLLLSNRLATMVTTPDTRALVAESLLGALRDARFETEVTDILAVPLIAGDEVVEPGGLQAAISFPSILSDSMLSLIGKRAIMVRAWSWANGGIAPSDHPTESLRTLQKSQVFPPFLRFSLARLERDSQRPFLRQWCYEFDSLDERTEEEGSSSFMHFSSGDHQDRIGQFTSIANHMARSAYLRTLALAVERWQMPLAMAEHLSEGVRPVCPELLGFAPTRAPEWSDLLASASSTDDYDCLQRMKLVFAERTRQPDGVLVHADFLITERKFYALEAEIVTAYTHVADIKAQEVFSAHDGISETWSYDIVDEATLGTSAEAGPGGRVVLATVPLSGDYLGQFNSDLMSRRPFAPRLFATKGSLRTKSRSSRVDFLSGSDVVGAVSFWNRDWTPTHLKFLKPNCGVATTVSSSFNKGMEEKTQKANRAFWRLRVARREKEYGPWEVTELFGGEDL